MYPHHVFDLEPAGTFGIYPICYQRVSGRYFQPEPAMYSRCFHWFPGPLTPSEISQGKLMGSIRCTRIPFILVTINQSHLLPLLKSYSSNPLLDPKTHFGTGTIELFFVMILTTPYAYHLMFYV